MNYLHNTNSSADPMPESAFLPWQPGTIPLMLAPMQGLTNRALRSLFIDWVRPDVVFTEFMRVNAAAPVKRLSAVDLKEAAATEEGVPLVVQLIGHSPDPLVAAARAAQAAGAVHINLNMGCPYGRTTSGFTGGAMLRRPEDLEATIPALRKAVTGTFSVKLRSGYYDPEQIFSLLPLFEASGVDFLVLHPRTVVQEYGGYADHAVTARVVQQTRLPVIANGDIRDAAAGLRVLGETGAAGLMLGRGAIADPLLFQRLRGKVPAEPERGERGAMLRYYLTEATARYRELFCGDTQVLGKLKAMLAPMADADFAKTLREMRRAKTLHAFTRMINELE
jgi:tRNA-dihydrouridine synthase B